MVSKLIWFFLQPLHALLIFLALGLWLAQRETGTEKWRGRGRRLSWAALALAAAMGFSPLGQWLMAPLEARFARPVITSPPDGIVVLANSMSLSVTAARDGAAFNSAADRLVTTALLGRRFPKARIVLAGGSPAITRPDGVRLGAATDFMQRAGAANSRFQEELKSRNTYENAVFTKRMMQPKAGERWLLVTSAWHMPRAMGCFRKAGFDVTPYPVDYRTPGPNGEMRGFRDAHSGITYTNIAMREWLGLLGYWIRGRTSALFPGPEK